MDQKGQFADFRLTAKRDAKAANAFPKQAIGGAALPASLDLCTDKAPAYRVIQDLNHRYDPHFDSILHIARKGLNDRIESDHAALKRPIGTRQSFRSLRSAKAALMAVEAIRTIKNGHISDKAPGVCEEIDSI